MCALLNFLKKVYFKNEYVTIMLLEHEIKDEDDERERKKEKLELAFTRLKNGYNE